MGRSLIRRRPIGWLWVVLGGSLLLALPGGARAQASEGAQEATLRVWPIGADPAIRALDPHETVPDVAGITGHVGAPAMVTAMQNTQASGPGAGFCGLLFWNPETNAFKSYGVWGGFSPNVDVDRSPPAPSDAPAGTFGGGDVWLMTTPGYLFVNFRGSNAFRRWELDGVDLRGIRVASGVHSGKVYLADYGSPRALIELDPTTNAVRRWPLGNRPYGLMLDPPYVWATATADGMEEEGHSDQILRLNTVTGQLRRWNVPGSDSFQGAFVGLPNSIVKDGDGDIWFTQSASGEVGRLDPVENTFDEYRHASDANPQGLAASGSGSSLRIWLVEAGDLGTHGTNPGALALLTPAGATPALSTTVAPSEDTISADKTMSTSIDFVLEPVTTTVAPSSVNVSGAAASGLARFPLTGGLAGPVGIAAVPGRHELYGSMERSDHVFEVEGVASAPPPAPLPTPAPPTSPSPGTLRPSDVVAPEFLSARLRRTRFAVDPKGPRERLTAARARERSPRGTTFIYRLSEAARVLFRIERAANGRRVEGGCRKPTRANRRRRSCIRFVHAGTFAHESVTGGNTKAFSGKLGRRSLDSGRYHAVLTAVDQAGNVSKRRSLTFTVVRR